MSRNVAKRAAQIVAGEIIDAARNSGPDPVAWVTGNSMFPLFRDFWAGEQIWQLPSRSPEAWQSFCERVEDLVGRAGVDLATGPDGSLYAVDMSRFEYIAEEDRAQDETLQDEWRLITS